MSKTTISANIETQLPVLNDNTTYSKSYVDAAIAKAVGDVRNELMVIIKKQQKEIEMLKETKADKETTKVHLVKQEPNVDIAFTSIQEESVALKIPIREDTFTQHAHLTTSQQPHPGKTKH